jgi:carbonic anhydrase/acetyltransferase-like protein (isoleucine patch superfamily)
VFAATNAFADVVPVPKPFHAGEEQTDARMIYVGESESGGLLAIDNHAKFMLARDDNNIVQNWCNSGTFKWSFGLFGSDGPRSIYPGFEADLNDSPALTFKGDDRLRMILEPGFGYTLPESITDGKLSVELWVINPSVEENEVLVRFEDKPVCDLTCKQFKMKDSNVWQHLAAVSDGSKVTFYRNGKLVGSQKGVLKFSGDAIINLGAESLTGSIAAFRIHTEAMNTTDITHNFKGGPELGTYLFYAMSAKEPDHSYWGDPGQCEDLSWHESEHFRSMWKEKDNPRPDDDIGARIKNKQLKDLETVYKYLNEKSGKHLPFVSNNEAMRGDGRKYKWLVGNGYGGSWMGSSPLGLGYGITYAGNVNPHEYVHGTDAHQMGNITGQWWEAHANFQVAWLGNPQVNPVTNCPKHAHVYPTTGGNYYHSYLIWDHLVETPKFGGIYVTRLWNRGPKAGYGNEHTVFPPKGMAEMDPSPETPFSQEWVKMAARNITWDYPSHPEYAKVYATLKYNTRKHYTLLEKVPYLDAGWYEPPKWRTPQQFGYNISPLEVKVGKVTADLQGFVSEEHKSDWSAMFVAVNDGRPRYGEIFTTATKGNFKVIKDDEELYLVVVATPERIMPQGIFANDPLCDYRKPGKDRFPYQVKLSGTSPKASLWRPTPGIHGQVDPTAYVSPNAYIDAGAKVLGNARVEDFATVYGTVQDNAVVSGYTTIEPKATICDDARVTDYAIIREGATVENSARVMEHADINRGVRISNYAVCKGNAEISGPVHGTAIIDGNYIKNGDREKGYWFQWSWGDGHHIGELDEEFNQLYLEYKFEKQDDYRVWDSYGATWARLLNGSTYVKDHEGTVLELDGKDDFVDLHQSVAQFESVSFDLDVKWDGGAKNQTLINFSNSATGDAAWLSPSDSEGKLAFSIKVGDKLQVVRATKPLPPKLWINLKLMTFHDTLLIHVDDIEWAKSESFTLDIEDVNPNECYIGRGARGNNFGGRIDNLAIWSKSLFDTLPPDPNPADFLLDPMVMDGRSVMMQARLAADSSKPVEYFFEETSGNPGGSDSGWQESPLYFDLELSPGKEYKYTVRARDSRNNTTKNSAPAAIITPRKHPGWFVQNDTGTVSMEAENYDNLTTGTLDKQDWIADTRVPGFSGKGVMHVPDRGKQINLQYSPDVSPRMDFNVMFNKPGTYFMHVRGHGINPNGDSCHGGLDMQQSPGLIAIGSFPTRSGEYKWMGGKKFEVPHAGLHKINLWMREDGAMIDKIVITTSGQLPRGKGPEESPRGGGDIVKTK